MNKQAKELTKAMFSIIASLLFSVKNTVIEYQTKLFPFAKAFLGLCLSGLLLVSCASGPAIQPGKAGNIWWSWDCKSKVKNEWVDFSISAIDEQNIDQYWYNDPSGQSWGYFIPLGDHNVEVSTKWSNQSREKTRLNLNVKEGRRYVVNAYELEEGQDPNRASIHCEKPPSTPRGKISSGYEAFFTPLFGKDGKNWGQMIATRSGNESTGEVIAKETAGYMVELIESAVAGGLLPFLLPAALIEAMYKGVRSRRTAALSQDNATNALPQPTDNKHDSTAQHQGSIPDVEAGPKDTVIAIDNQPADPPPAPTARPFDGCCYVWIEDFETKEVVTGRRLPGAGR